MSCKGRKITKHYDRNSTSTKQTNQGPASKKAKLEDPILQDIDSSDDEAPYPLNNTTTKSNSGDDNSITTTTTTEEVVDIIASWRYSGDTLTKEKIAINDFIDLKLVQFEDLVRINNAYDRLLDIYSRILTDEIESRDTVKVVLQNLETLQTSIKEIYKQTAGELGLVYQCQSIVLRDNDNDNTHDEKTVEESQNSLVPYEGSRSIVVRSDEHNLTKEKKQDYHVEINNYRSLTCKNTLSGHRDIIWALEPYVMNGKNYLASASQDGTIKLWDLSSNTLAATLTGHTASVFAIASFVKDGVQMLASGDRNNSVKLWDLTNYTFVHTLSAHNSSIESLAVNVKDGKTILVSGSVDDTIKVWDLEGNKVLATLDGHRSSINALSIYIRNDLKFLASGSSDCSIKIWSLESFSLQKSLEQENDEIYSLAQIDCYGKHILASGHCDGRIKLWSLDNYECIKFIKATSGSIWSLQVFYKDTKVCLAFPDNKKSITLWDMQRNKKITTLHNGAGISILRVFMNGDRAFMACGDEEGRIKLWA